jgi:TolA-binding protein
LKFILSVLAYLSLSTIVYADNQIYAVQVLRVREYKSAVYDYERLMDHDARIEKINDTYVVRIGAYRMKTKALSLLKQLKLTYTDAFIVKYIIDKRQIVQGDYPTDQQKGKKAAPLSSSKHKAKRPALPTQPPTVIPISTPGKNHESSQSPEDTDPPSDTPKQLFNGAKQATEIVQKLPELQTQSTETEEEFFKAGMQNYHKGKHEDTVSSLSKYTSLTPKSPQRAAALLIIGKSLEQIKRPKSALDVYSRIIEQYPDSPESLFSIVAMADISANHPRLHYPIGKKSAEYVRDPISAYDTVLSRNIPLPMIEHIHYQKCLVLWKLKRYEQAREAQENFLKQFPNTPYHREVTVMLKDSTAALINQYSRLGDHITVASLFIHGWKNRLITTEDVETLSKSLSSLSYLDLHDDSLNILSTIKKRFVGKTSVDLDKAFAEMEKKTTIGLMAQPSLDTKWNKFQSGREYLSANNITKAEQTFSDLKNSDGDLFWAKITEYALEENRWTQKYRSPIENNR